MATTKNEPQNINLQIFPQADFEQLLGTFYPSGTFGYVSLSNNQFRNLLEIKSDTPPPASSLHLRGVSDYPTVVFPDTTITWEILDQDPSLPMPSSNLEGLSIDSILIFDTVNYGSVFIDVPKPLFNSKNTKWSCTTKGVYTDDSYPGVLAYRILFSFAYNNNYYYFQFDPLITPQPKP